MNYYKDGWDENFPDVVCHTGLRELKYDKHYFRAKMTGDIESSIHLAVNLIDRDKALGMKRKFGDAIIVPVIAEERHGENMIPLLCAKRIAQITGMKVCEDIKQVNKVFHTGASTISRLVNVPKFEGKVERGRKYVLIDDVVISGSTFSNLAYHISKNGGEIVLATALSENIHKLFGHAGKLAMHTSTLQLIEKKFGINQINDLLCKEGLAPSLKHLSNGQGIYISLFKSIDRIRDRIIGEKGKSSVKSLRPVLRRSEEKGRGR